MPILFKSEVSGIFSQIIKLVSKPGVCAGGDLKICLSAIVEPQDKMKPEREAINVSVCI